MRAVIQRVKKASVKVSGECIAKIEEGLLIFLGIENEDDSDDLNWLAGKIARLRIFSDSNENMNNSVIDVDGNCLVVSQFTLHASTKKGNRPSFIKAARPEQAIPLYKAFIDQLEIELEKPVEIGEFGAMMDIDLINDGPVTILIDSKNRE